MHLTTTINERSFKRFDLMICERDAYCTTKERILITIIISTTL